MNELILTYRGVVYPSHCDHMGHMNVAWYISKFDEATWQLTGIIGITSAFMKEHHRGMVAAEQHTYYKRELLAGNRVCIRTGVIEVKEKVIRFFHEMFNEDTGEIAAITILTGVHIDSKLRRACAMPEEAIKKAKELVTDYKPV
jgi:acyl-CoA thioester hydrolase